MTNNQELTIEACKYLVSKYRNAESKMGFFTSYTCPLCDIYPRPKDCIGCPLASEHGRCGCVEFASYKRASARPFSKENFEARAQFFEKIIPILEKLPPERFTKKGWKYTGDIIPREW